MNKYVMLAWVCAGFEWLVIILKHTLFIGKLDIFVYGFTFLGIICCILAFIDIIFN
jgi:hypothetical protein